MRSLLESTSVILGGLSRFTLWLSAAGLVLMTVVTGWQVWGRYVLNDTPIWSEQFSLMLMLYYIMFAAAVGVREKFHLGLVFFVNLLPATPRKCLLVFTELLVAFFGLFMVSYGSEMVALTWGQPIPTVGLPTGMSYLPFPIAGVMITLFSLEHIPYIIAGRDDQEVEAPCN